MDQDQDPDSIVHDLIDEAVASMGGNSRVPAMPLMSEHREIGESGDGIAEQSIYSQRSVWVARFEVIPDSVRSCSASGVHIILTLSQ